MKMFIIFQGYHAEYVDVCRRHLRYEYEVQIRDGRISLESSQVVQKLKDDFEKIQVEIQIDKILVYNVSLSKNTNHLLKLLQPVRADLLAYFEKTSRRLQQEVQDKVRLENNKMCEQKSQTGPVIHNFTEFEISCELSEFLKSGLNNVPEIHVDSENVAVEVENEVKIACRNAFKSIVGVFPHSVSLKDSLDTVIKNLMILAPNNAQLMDSLTSIRECYSSRLPIFIRSLKNNKKKSAGMCNIEYIRSLVPGNSILSPSDKNLGVCMLPPCWYREQYQEQIIKGGYEIQNMTEIECLALLQNKISVFKENLPHDQKQILNRNWPRISIKNPRIGVLKIVPKIHKLKNPINSETWSELKSRPIRGAESDPMKIPSRSLYFMLQKMLSDFKEKFPEPNASNQLNNFSVLKGCEDYISRLKRLSLDPEAFSRTFLISADFSDAFTMTQIPRLQESISVVGNIIDYSKPEIDLMISLVDLVFSNCYFITPSGLYRQTKGMPMGDYSSRDGLDVDLTRSEYEILFLVNNLSLKIHLYTRLVDDISIIAQGSFEGVLELLNVMSERYPTMPLNVQVSMKYSRFLDLRLYNMKSEHQGNYGITTNLAYKEHSSFSFTPKYSNIHMKYKTAIVPISLYRAFSRCTETKDIAHHIEFMKKITKARDQDEVQVQEKIKKFFRKQKDLSRPKVNKESFNNSVTTPVLFDNVSEQHQFVGNLVKESFGKSLQVVYRSRNKMSSSLCPKRETIKKLTKLWAKSD